jgi:hypothetical protein
MWAEDWHPERVQYGGERREAKQIRKSAHFPFDHCKKLNSPFSGWKSPIYRFILN